MKTLDKKFGIFRINHYLCSVMELRDFLNKETPNEGGCMVCLAKYKVKDYNPAIQAYEYNHREEYVLVERHKCANCDMFTINKRFHYDYEFAWDEQTPWEILYKKEP